MSVDRTPTEDATLASSQAKFFNRELSWLEFNQRVLDEALNRETAPLERLRFLAITASNLDEFFMVRVGGLQLAAAGNALEKDAAGLTPRQQLDVISRRTHEMTADQYIFYLDTLEPLLAEAGIKRVRPQELTERQRTGFEQVFEEELYAVLTPMIVGADEDFPILCNQVLHVFVRLAPEAEGGEPRFAIIPLGRCSPRFITVPSDGGYAFVLLEDAVAFFAERFFPGEEIIECVPFRITRNADFAVREDLASDLMVEIEEVLDARRTSDCVRLEVSDHITTASLDFLRRALALAEHDVYALPGPLDFAAFMSLADVSGFDHLRDEPWPPQPAPRVDASVSMFEVIAQKDLLLYHPYESFEPVVRFLEEAADDPHVLAIKQTLYRTSRGSPVVAALRRAAEAGKYVTAIVELKARFDERRNIGWARELEESGAQVIYGIRGLKTHAKLCIIVRREPRGVRRYMHFGTGNYNESTAKLYSDVSFMTCNEDLAADATSFFNAITGYSQPQKYRKLEAAPIGLRDNIIELIESETARKKQGHAAKITAKINSLVDAQLINALYKASQAGVPVRLNVRGICCLKPGVANLSENISVVSIVDRFLEHARIFSFHHGGEPRVFISSADWMPRNLDRRIELLTPVEDAECRNRLLEILEVYFLDNVKARYLNETGAYQPPPSKPHQIPLRSQAKLYQDVCRAAEQAKQSSRTVFEPHWAPGSEDGE